MAVALGLLEILVLFTTETKDHVLERSDVHGNKHRVQFTVTRVVVMQKLDVRGQIIHRIARLWMKRLADLRPVVLRTLTIAPTTRTVAGMARRVTQLTAVVFVAMIAVRVLVPADHGLLVAQVATIPIVVRDPTSQGIVQACTAQLVAARHRAGVSTILPTATMSLAATGQQQSHLRCRQLLHVPIEIIGFTTHPAPMQM